MTHAQRLSIVAAISLVIARPTLGDGPTPKPDGVGPALVEAVNLAGTIKDPSSRAKTLAAFARAQAIEGDIEGSRRTFALAVSLADNLPFDEPDHIMHALVRIGNEQLAAGDRSGAIATYRRLLELTVKSLDRNDTYLYKYANIINFQVKSGNREGVRITLESARRACIKQGEKNGDRAAKMRFAYLQAAAHDFNGAFAAFAAGDEMPGDQANILSEIAHSAAGCDPAEGRIVLERVLASSATIKKPVDSSGPCRAIAWAAASLGDFELAFRADRAEMQWLARMSDVDGDDLADSEAQCFAMIAERQAEAGLRDDARDTISRADILSGSIQDAHMRRSCLMQVRRAEIRLGLYEEALRPVEGDDADMRSHLREDADRARAKAGDRTALRRRFGPSLAEAEAQLLGVISRSTERTIERNTAEALVAYYRAELGDIEAASKMVKEIRSVDARSRSLQGIATIQARSGDIAGVVEWVGRLDDPALRASCVRAIADGLIERNAAARAADKPKP